MHLRELDTQSRAGVTASPSPVRYIKKKPEFNGTLAFIWIDAGALVGDNTLNLIFNLLIQLLKLLNVFV